MRELKSTATVMIMAFGFVGGLVAAFVVAVPF